MISTLKTVDEESLSEIREEKDIRQTDEVFLLFPLGSQFDHLIKQALEKLGVFCLVADPASVTKEDVKLLKPKGIILSGGPASVHEDPPPFDEGILDLSIPVLGICLGFQVWAKHLRVKVTPAEKREFGVHNAELQTNTALFHDCKGNSEVLQSHGDIIAPGAALTILATTDNCPVAAARHGHLWGVQFHPEVSETEDGPQIFDNFCFIICGARDKFPAQKIAEQKIIKLRQQIGDSNVLLALSGGSDSSTVAYLLKEAMKDSKGGLRGVYIRGIDRPDDEEFVHRYFGNEKWIELILVDATNEFLDVLAGHESMKDKRIAMRGVYKTILEQQVEEFNADFIAQGTLYTDISESGGGHDSGAKKARIKLHHNINLGFSVEELTPLDNCVKDGGRAIGRKVGVPEELLIRHPFPGPGLVVRIEGEITAEKLAIAHKADEIYIQELRKRDLYKTVWQAGAVVTSSITTCTKGDDAASGHVLAIWAVSSVNGFTAQPMELPWDFLRNVERRLTNEIREVGSVVYRISGKPPSTIEWG